MPFIRIEGFTGNVYVPEKNQGKKKHPCQDCYICQFCSDERCVLCLKNQGCKKKSPSDVNSQGEKTADSITAESCRGGRS